ncbi:MAG: tRNA(Met) cytidine acetyltransferase TmcA domain-containing protein, partial [Halopseudomonas sp.]
MPPLNLRPLLAHLHQRAVQNHQRHLLVLVGRSDWALNCINQLPQTLLWASGLWVSNQPELPQLGFADQIRLLKPSRCHQVLGQEFLWGVIDGSDGVDPDALGACSGTLCGGGLLVLLLPPSDGGGCSPFDNWLHQCLRPSQGVSIVRQGAAIPESLSIESAAPILPEPELASVAAIDADCVTDDQAEAVKQIIRVAQGHRRRPLVLSADRGRGKTAALGIAAARLLQQRPRYIRVTAPTAAAIEPLFERLQAMLPNCRRQGAQVVFEQSKLEFVALDLLLSQLEAGQEPAQQCDLLLVDEAAAIPAPMLERLLRHHARIVFSSTVHGFEGTGRGFLIRFRQALDRYTPNWRQFELSAPIRWREGDPLERWVFDTLLLDAEPYPITEQKLDLTQVKLRLWSSTQLLDDPQQLRQMFALLVQAHYRTTPGDLRDLLNEPSMQVWLLHQTGSKGVLGVILVSEEGGFEPPLAEAIWLGQG